MNQNNGTMGIKHALAMLMIMTLEDASHQRPNVQYVASQPTAPDSIMAADAGWLRDLLPLVDQKVYAQIRALMLGSIAVPGGLVDGQLLDDTAKGISLVLQGLSENYHSTYGTTATDGLQMWDSNCYPHPPAWRVREVVAGLLA